MTSLYGPAYNLRAQADILERNLRSQTTLGADLALAGLIVQIADFLKEVALVIGTLAPDDAHTREEE